MVVVQLSSLRLMAALSLTARSTVRARAPGLARLFSAGRCGLARSFQLLELQLLELCCALCAQAFPGVRTPVRFMIEDLTGSPHLYRLTVIINATPAGPGCHSEEEKS